MKIQVTKAAKRFVGKSFDLGEVSKVGTSLNPDKTVSFQMHFFKSVFLLDNKQYKVMVINRPWCEKWQVKLEPIDETGARTITFDDIKVLD